MSGPTLIDPRGATPADALVGMADGFVGLADARVGEAALAWICPSCGALRVFEGGRPAARSERADCPDCGCRLADPSPRGSVAASTNSYLL